MADNHKHTAPYGNIRSVAAFSIYSKDEKEAFALVRFECRQMDVVKAVREGKFPLEEIKGFFERAAAALTEAVKTGREDATSTKK